MPPSDPTAATRASILATYELDRVLDPDEYAERLPKLQHELSELAFELYERKRGLIAVFEGWDASGKGGAIRRTTAHLDPRGYVVESIAAPEGDDKRHHYLWRFWRRLRSPEETQIVIFDRSWYGRVMVERVEGFATEAEWRRAYREINDFERQLVDSGYLLAKFWIHISKEEQERRFAARRETPHKAWKLTDEDWRNREKWNLYAVAVDEMLAKTSTPIAPWTVVASDDKRFARVQVVTHLVEQLRSSLRPED